MAIRLEKGWVDAEKPSSSSHKATKVRNRNPPRSLSTSDAVWELPDPRSVLEVRHDDDSVTFVRRHGLPGGPRLLLCHGNGLAIDFYYPFWSLLEETCELVVYDLRNHGWNAVGARTEHNFPNLIRDQEQVVEAVRTRYGDKPMVGVFHSLSALVALLSPTLGTGRTGELAGWFLLDPPLYRPGPEDPDFDDVAEKAAGMAQRRAHRFQKRSEFAELVSYMRLLLRAVPGASELMAQTVLRESEGEDGFELRCPRDYEAQIIAYVRTFAFLVDFGDLPCPTKVIGSDPTLPYAYLPTFDLSHIEAIDYDFMPEATHFLQLEKPAECVAALKEFLEDRGLS